MRHHFLLVLLAVLLLPPAANARPVPGPDRADFHARLIRVQNTEVSARGAARAVRQATGGRVLAVKRIRTDEGPAYRVKVLIPGGRIRVVLVDASSGALR